MRYLLFLFSLAFAAPAAGQIYIDSYRFGSADLLLDSFPGAAAAYSLRLLDKDYAGNCIMVRRKSNGDSLNIGFSGNYLDTTAMKSFCGSGATDTCYVRVWYDQSGNNFNIRNTVAIEQPRIYANNAFIRNNGDISVFFDGINDRLTNPAASFMNNVGGFSAFIVTLCTDTTQIPNSNLLETIYAGGNARVILAQGRTTALRFGLGGRRVSGDSFQYSVSTTNDDAQLGLIIGLIDYANADLYVYKNTTELVSNLSFQSTGNTDTDLNSQFTLGGRSVSGVDQYKGVVQEAIIYNSYKQTERIGISTNINNFYSIY